MILDELVVHNFGPFADRQKIRLTPPSSGKPIVLFGGLNGHGKTTLLDALQLCLYGPFSGIASRDKISYNDYLSKCVHRHSGIKEAALELAFRHTLNGQESRYRLHRSWRVGKSGCRERFEILKDRRPNEVLAENWLSEVEDLFPPNIAGLFFFDGEQAEQYATPESSVHLIGTAIRNLLGLDIVDQLSKDLVVYARRKRMEEKNDPVTPNLEEKEGCVAKLDEQIANLQKKRDVLNSENLNELRKRLENIEIEYRRLGGELYEERIEIERQLSESENHVEKCKDHLRSLASGALPLVLVFDLLKTIQAQDQEEEKTRLARELAVTLLDRDKELVQEMTRQNFGEARIDTISKWLDDNRVEQQEWGARNVILGLSPTARAHLHSLLSGGLDELNQTASSELARYTAIEAKAEGARQKHASIPRGDMIGELIRQREVIRTEIAVLESRLVRIDDEVEHLTRQRNRSQDLLLRLLEQDARATGVREDRARVLDHVVRVRRTLDMFRASVIERHVARIADLVFDSFQQLLRKSTLVSRLEIDPQSFALTLFGHDGYPLGADRLSAGERQLLAIALLWGFAKASGRALPTAIDTPLGRLDASHRSLVVERYFPCASHQVLLFSTDEEITGRYLNELQPYVGHCYNLIYDDESASTKINLGYFSGEELNCDVN